MEWLCFYFLDAMDIGSNVGSDAVVSYDVVYILNVMLSDDVRIS